MGAVSHSLCLALVMCLSSVASAAETPGASDKHSAAQNLDYGEGLYHYYQGDYAEALSTLELARQQGGISGHGHYPELMRAGMYLAFGMTDKARAEFAAHLGQGEAPEVRDTAHFFLARLSYQAGDYPAAANHLQALEGALPASLQDEAALLAVHLQIQSSGAPSLNSAQSLLEPLGDNLYLALLNLGNSAARAGDPIRAQSYYNAMLEAEPPEDNNRVEEYLAVRDKTYTALGYSYLGQRDYASAKAAFREVRLDNALANRALLGYGWAAASYHDYVLALKPWQALRQRSLLDPAVQESLLAVPWAYEQIDATGAALGAYRESEQLLNTELANLDTAISAMSREALLAQLTGDAPHPSLSSAPGAQKQNWLTLDSVSVMSSDLTYLDGLLISDEFQAQVQNLRDLLGLADKLDHWSHKLAIYSQLLEEKRSRRAARAQQVADSGLLQQPAELMQERDQLANTLANVRQQRDALALAEGDTAALYQRLQNAETALQRLAASGRAPADAAAKLELYRGILSWRAEQNFAHNTWQIQKRLHQIDTTLEQSQTRAASIEQLLAEDPDIDADLARLAQVSQQNSQQLAGLRSAINARAEALATTLTEHLQGHRARLNDYLAQTRLSIARLLDDAYRADTPTDGPQLPEVAQ
ncbi:hypothetical protein [Gilvimarinus sp. DA14]|uniref:hypothetical protein n=1 Tax=Gilvimarinus sp. DA14 TaxID=2956798 RepID=UPI0020B63A2F|nr:hypothetical protein [Gilvimarinus sp. DA14]UTF58935.1 hypothetical protein NHM04_10640 [Gilvimarinus sp. DA14]